MSLGSMFKGWMGELEVTLAKKIRLNGDDYIDVNNVTIPTSKGTTQIDHVIVSRYGIFVVETKNYNGWIFGDEKSPQWTQSLYGKKYRFQNPLHQNYRHTKALSDFLGIAHEKFFPIVMFWGECELKTALPPNVMTRGYSGYIKSHTNVLFDDGEVGQIVSAIKSGMLPKTWATRSQHVQSLKEKHSDKKVCPKCGSSLVVRTAKSGVKVGNQFLGCSTFPKCRYVGKMESSK